MGRTSAGAIALAALLAVSAAPAAAQSARITGTVADAGTGRPVAGATLDLRGTTARAVTSEDGRFELTSLPPGRYALRVTHIGYGTHQDSVTVTGGSVVLAIRISPRAIDLETLNVETERERSETSRSYVVSRAQIEEMLGRARHIGDVVRAYIPGASVYEARAGYICVEFRAARGARTRGCNFPLVVVDDVPIPAPHQFLRDTQLEDIERIEFVPASAGAARYGVDSQYGALVIQTRRAGRARIAPERAVEPIVYPSYVWSREQEGHPWQKTLAASAAGNAIGVLGGLAALGCLGGGAEGDVGCVNAHDTGVGLATLALPLVGAAAGARVFGQTQLSHGRVLPAALAAAIPLAAGYGMYRDGEAAGFGTSRLLGGLLVFVGAPVAATIADGLFRRARASNPER